MYNIITFFSIVIGAMALVPFHAHFLEVPSEKKKNHSINKEKTLKKNFFFFLMQHARLDGIVINFI